jgi:hypothetical protein
MQSAYQVINKSPVMAPDILYWMRNYISHRYPFSCEGTSRYAAVVKSVHIQRNRISANGKCLKNYHLQSIVGKCYDMQLTTIILSQQRVKFHDPNK